MKVRELAAALAELPAELQDADVAVYSRISEDGDLTGYSRDDTIKVLTRAMYDGEGDEDTDESLYYAGDSPFWRRPGEITDTIVVICDGS